MCHVEEPHWQNGGHPRFGVGYQDMLDLNIVTTRHLAGWMQERGADPDRISVMYTGIRTSAQSISPAERSAIRAEYGIPPDAPLIVFAGRLCAQKRPQLLAQILGAVASRGLPFQALIIGEGELRAELEDALKKHKLQDRVQLLGSVAHAQWLRSDIRPVEHRAAEPYAVMRRRIIDEQPNTFDESDRGALTSATAGMTRAEIVGALKPID